jgi:cysteine synthase A
VLAAEMKRQNAQGSIVTLICDYGDRYARSCYDDAWLSAKKIDIAPYEQIMRQVLA